MNLFLPSNFLLNIKYVHLVLIYSAIKIVDEFRLFCQSIKNSIFEIIRKIEKLHFRDDYFVCKNSVCNVSLDQKERLKYALFNIDTYHDCRVIFLINSWIFRELLEVSHVRKEKIDFTCPLKIKIFIKQLPQALIFEFEELFAIVIGILTSIDDSEIIVWSVQKVRHNVLHLLEPAIVEHFDLLFLFGIAEY